MHEPINLVIADDSPIFLDGIRYMLAGYKQMNIQAMAMDGEELVIAVRAYEPDVVVTDIQMPIMNGIEATRVIKQQFPAMPVIALTSFGDTSFLLDMVDAGAAGYLVKTTSREDLVSAINTVVGGGQYFCKNTSKRVAAILTRREANAEGKEAIVLSEKEKEIMRLICQQRNVKEIADLLDHSPKTIDAYRLRIMEKISAKTTAGIVVYAMQTGLYKP